MSTDAAVLDNPVRAALARPQAGLAVTAGVACRLPLLAALWPSG